MSEELVHFVSIRKQEEEGADFSICPSRALLQ
jgi:hypothetical protein